MYFRLLEVVPQLTMMCSFTFIPFYLCFILDTFHFFTSVSQIFFITSLSTVILCFVCLLFNFCLFFSPLEIWFGYSLGGSDGKESTCNEGDLGLIPGLGRSPGWGHGNPLQNSFLENPHGQMNLVGYNPWGRRVGHNWVTKNTPILYIFYF